MDQKQVEATKTKLSAEVERLIEQLQQMEATEGLFKISKSRSLILTASGIVEEEVRATRENKALI